MAGQSKVSNDQLWANMSLELFKLFFKDTKRIVIFNLFSSISRLINRELPLVLS